MIGQTISHYKILEKLGGGGMGVVYKAEDTKLHRTVALKFLPPTFSFDEEAKQRFVHEAQAASSLQHNNLCNIHDIDETDDGQMFICMDFYDGEILKKKIVNGPLKINEAIDITIQIAQGLLKSHEKGIIHRDIKPANIFITNDGVVKILDFGLAKLSGQTMMTKTGSTLGTVAYMSPEQSRGEQVDNRSDIWSLGVVMYEMMTGERPFKGEFEQVIIYSILNKEPEPITGLRNDIPFELELMVNKCLEKDKEYRYQHIDDLLLDLRRAKRETPGVSIPTGDLKRTKTKVVEKIRTKNTKKYVWMSSGIFIFITIVCALIFWPSKSEIQLNPNRIMRTLNLPNKQILYPSISADGNWIAYPAVDVNGNWNVYLTHSMSGEAPISIVNEKKNSEMIWSTEISPNGSHIVYDQGAPYYVKIIPTFGGVTKNLDSLIDMNDFQWRPDGLRLGGAIKSKNHREFWTASYEGTDFRKEFVDTTTGNLFRNFDFAWSPNGKSVAWLRDFEEGGGYQEIFIHNLETGEEKQLTFAGSNIEALCWSSLNVIIFSATISGPLNLWMVPAEGGELTQITFGDGPDGPPRISMDGRLLIYPKIKMLGQIMIIPLSGREPKLVSAGEYTAWGWGPLLSPDGKWIAVATGDLRFGWAGARSNLYIMNRDGGQRYKISTGEWENVGIYSWSPDGKWLAFQSTRFFDKINICDIYILNVIGNNQPKKLTRVDKFLDLTWIDSLNLNIRAKDRFYRYNLIQDKIVEDTVFCYPIKDRTEVLIQHLDGSWWIRKRGEKQKIQQPENVHLSLTNLCWFGWDLDKGFRTISLIDGKIKDYPIFQNVKFPAEIFGVLCNLSDDGKEVVFATQEMQGQISIIENPFIIK